MNSILINLTNVKFVESDTLVSNISRDTISNSICVCYTFVYSLIFVAHVEFINIFNIVFLTAEDDPRRNTTCDVCGKVMKTRQFPIHMKIHLGKFETNSK